MVHKLNEDDPTDQSETHEDAFDSVENKDDKFGKDFTVTQMRKRKSTIRRIGSLKRTPSVKAFQCQKEFCGFLTSTADKLAVHVDRVHGAYHDLLSPHSPELAPKTQKSSIYEAKRLSDIMWGTMAAGLSKVEESDETESPTPPSLSEDIIAKLAGAVHR